MVRFEIRIDLLFSVIDRLQNVLPGPNVVGIQQSQIEIREKLLRSRRLVRRDWFVILKRLRFDSASCTLDCSECLPVLASVAQRGKISGIHFAQLPEQLTLHSRCRHFRQECIDEIRTLL